ncbi:MAG: methyltransferase domain-containing protein [Bacteroidales bacterium]|nr:methyltransferase domain-containing protein [Bacteroidales bacterium]
MGLSKKNKHPILSNDFVPYLNNDIGQLFSVEAALDSVIPWINYVCPLKNQKILIFGTGGGGTAVACALNINDGIIYGVDISKWAIETTTKRAKKYDVLKKMQLYHLTSTYPLPFKDNFFDIAIVADVIEHIVDERSKYVKNIFNKLKKEGLLIITGTPNLLYPKDIHTTGLYFIPWLPKKMAYKYAIYRGKWEKGKNLDYAGRRGITYWHLLKWLKGFNYQIINKKRCFSSNYLKNHNRINTRKRKYLFPFYLFLEIFLSKIFNVPIVAFLPYINHLFIKKNNIIGTGSVVLSDIEVSGTYFGNPIKIEN